MSKTPTDKTPPDKCNDLETLRRQIDAIDDEILTLLVERSSYVRRAAELKPEEKIVDEARIKSILARLKAQATKQGLEPEVVESLWRALIKTFIKMEYKIFAKN